MITKEFQYMINIAKTTLSHIYEWKAITNDLKTYRFESWMSEKKPATYRCKEARVIKDPHDPSIWNENDFSQLYDEFANNPFYDIIKSNSRYYQKEITKHPQTNVVNISKIEFISMIKQEMIRWSSPIIYYIYHIVRASEVKTYYEEFSSIVINGIECDKYVDAGIGYIGYHDTYPGYIEIEGPKYKEVIATIPQEDLKWITIGNAKDGIGKFYIIPKKYIDKIILRRKYLHPDLIEFCLEKFYTGEEDVYELDPKNPDPEILNMMVKYGVVLFYVDENQDTIKSVSSKRTLTIGGKEYDAVRNNEETIVLCHDLMTGYDLSSKSDIRKLYNDLINNTFVHGICKETLYEDLSMEDFLTLMQTAKKEAEAKQVPLRQIVCPFHRVSQSEVEAFCEYESSIMMGEYYNKDSWVECKDFLDLNCQQPCFSETYPEYVSVDAESSEALCKTLADCYYKRITINDGENDRAREITIFKKSIVKQIKLYRRYLDACNIEHSLDAPYTGKEEEFVLNKSEIYPKDLELMKKYGVIVEKELK